MSPVFRHGRLRLYLLKLLDDAPKHGYEVIRLLQDRFMGVYAPSPGTIYPRLARLEEEGLVTHDDVEGRKVYRLTDKGREEINERMDDLAELEEEITESVRDIAREVKEDVRETVRSLREEIARAARDVRQDAERERDEAGDEAGQAWDRATREREQGRQDREQARREREQTRWERGARRERAAGAGSAAGAGATAGAGFQGGRGRGKRDWADWGDWGKRDWGDWARRDWANLRDWRDWPGLKDWPGSGAPRVPGWPDPAKFRDLERLALQFATELRRIATHASAIGEDAFGDLRGILDEALGRIRTEVFEPASTQGEASPQGEAGARERDDAGGSDGKDDLAE
jgi:DNA-binding PadR family transcriptional regulator